MAHKKYFIGRGKGQVYEGEIQDMRDEQNLEPQLEKQKYRIRWSIHGTAYVDAKDEQDARNQVSATEICDLIGDSIEFSISDVEEWVE